MEGALDSYPHDLCFSQDGSRLAASDLSGSLVVWEVSSGRTQHRYHGHGGGIRHPIPAGRP